MIWHCGQRRFAPNVCNQHFSQNTCQQLIEVTGLTNGSKQIKHLLDSICCFSFSAYINNKKKKMNEF